MFKYPVCGIRLDIHIFLSHRSGGTGRDVIIFGVDMSSSTKIDNRKKDILILGEGPFTRIRTYTVCRKKCI